MRNVTTLVTSITQFVDTAVTNYYNTSTQINTTYVASWDNGLPQIPATNSAHGRQTSMVLELNGTATVTAGVTVTSPQAFYIFSTVKVINVPAVTDSNGYAACTTTSTNPVVCTYGNSTTHWPDRIFPGINTHVESYFESAQTPISSAYNNSITSKYHYPVASTAEHQVLSFSTPFIYQPLRGAVERDADIELKFGPLPPIRRRALTPATNLTGEDGALEDFGYVPQTLIDWMAQNPDYAAQYPGLKSCLPGGPSILPPTICSEASPVGLESVPDLTLNQTFTVQGEGCFHPGACPTSQPTGQVSRTQAAPAATDTQAQPTQTAAPSSKGPADVPFVPQPLHPSGKGDPGSTESSGTQQELPKKEPPSTQDLPSGGKPPANSPPKDEATEHSTPETTTQTIPIVPSVTEEATSTSGIQLQPQSNEQSAKTKSHLNNQNQNQNDSGFLSPSTNQNQSPSKNNAPARMTVEAIQPNIASAIMAGFGHAPASPAPSPLTPLVEGGSTLIPGAAPLTILGTTYSIAPSGTAVVVNGATASFPATAGNTSPPPPFVDDGATVTLGFSDVTISGGTTYSVSSSGNAAVVIVNGTPSPLSAQGGTGSLPPGVTISGTVYSAAPSGPAVVVNGATSLLLATVGNASPPPLIASEATVALSSLSATVSGTTAHAIPSSGSPAVVFVNDPPSPPSAQGGTGSPPPFIAGGEVVTPGAPPMTVLGTTYSVAPSRNAVVVNSAASPFRATAGNENLLTLIAGGVTLTPGSRGATVSGTTYSIPSSGSPTALFINGSPSPLSVQGGTGSPPPFIAGGATVTPGSPGVTISGTTYSIPSSGNPTAVFVNGSPSPLPVHGGTGNPAPFVAGGETLRPGVPPVTVSGTTYSVASEGGAVVVNGETSSLPVVAGTANPPLVLGSGITATPAGAAGTAQPELVIGSQTLAPGAAITVSGIVISLPSAAGTGAGNEVVVGGSTETFTAPTGGAGAVGISIGSEVVTASFTPQTASASGGLGDGNGTESAGTGQGGSGGGGNVTVQGFRSGSWRRWDWDVRWTGCMVGVVLFGMVVV
ncbi:MAG: hypothetical protein LQ338_005126 [Usnochroma carphineum]|nr:MAG: hypothetical protein LQ338_005126 [Usnochroma carphineum]